MTTNTAIQYIRTRLLQLYPNLNDEMSVEDFAALGYSSIMGEGEGDDRREALWPSIVMEGCVGAAKSILTTRAQTGGKNMTKHIRDAGYVFSHEDMEDSVIKLGGGRYIRFGAVKIDQLEEYRQRKADNIEKMVQDYENFCASMTVVEGPMLEHDFTMAEYLQSEGRLR